MEIETINELQNIAQIQKGLSLINEFLALHNDEINKNYNGEEMDAINFAFSQVLNYTATKLKNITDTLK